MCTVSCSVDFVVNHSGVQLGTETKILSVNLPYFPYWVLGMHYTCTLEINNIIAYPELTIVIKMTSCTLEKHVKKCHTLQNCVECFAYVIGPGKGIQTAFLVGAHAGL